VRPGVSERGSPGLLKVKDVMPATQNTIPDGASSRAQSGPSPVASATGAVVAPSAIVPPKRAVGAWLEISNYTIDELRVEVARLRKRIEEMRRMTPEMLRRIRILSNRSEVDREDWGKRICTFCGSTHKGKAALQTHFKRSHVQEIETLSELAFA
jgi:hypothetical protein